MHIRMLKTADGSVNGIRVQPYDEGVEYDLSQTAGARDLAQAFVGAGLAEEVGAKRSALADAELPADGDDGAAGESPATPAKAGRKSKSQ